MPCALGKKKKKSSAMDAEPGCESDERVQCIVMQHIMWDFRVVWLEDGPDEVVIGLVVDHCVRDC